MEVYQITNTGSEGLRDQIRYEDEVLTYEKNSINNATSVYWRTSMRSQNFFEEITEDFDTEDYAMVVFSDEYGQTLDEEHEGLVETTLGQLTDIEDMHNRAKFVAVENEGYSVTWENLNTAAEDDIELCFLLKTEESADKSLLRDFMDETLDQSDRFYEDVKDLHASSFKELKAKAK